MESNILEKYAKVLNSVQMNRCTPPPWPNIRGGRQGQGTEPPVVLGSWVWMFVQCAAILAKLAVCSAV